MYVNHVQWKTHFTFISKSKINWNYWSVGMRYITILKYVTSTPLKFYRNLFRCSIVRSITIDNDDYNMNIEYRKEARQAKAKNKNVKSTVKKKKYGFCHFCLHAHACVIGKNTIP